MFRASLALPGRLPPFHHQVYEDPEQVTDGPCSIGALVSRPGYQEQSDMQHCRPCRWSRTLRWLGGRQGCMVLVRGTK